MMNDGSVHLFEASLRPLIEQLSNGKIGICSGNIRVTDIKSGRSAIDKSISGDRFKIVIPFAGQSLIWDVIFIGNSSIYPPDFAFDDKSFLPDLHQLKSLGKWNKDDHHILLNLIQELLEYYRRHQVAQIEEHSRLNFEYSSLIQQSDLSENDVEVQIHKKSKNGPVNFLIRLPIDFSRIPSKLVEGTTNDDSAVLLVTFNSPDGTKIVPQLFISPRIESALGGSSNLRIPAFPNGGCLMDYVPNVCQLLRFKVEQIIIGFEKRQEYMRAFLDHFGTSILEFDADKFTKLSLLFECNEFYFILHISLPVYFPQDKPVFMFQSIYYITSGRPFTVICQDYPYSPRWDGDEMAERAKAFILDFIPTFQASSVRSVRN